MNLGEGSFGFLLSSPEHRRGPERCTRAGRHIRPKRIPVWPQELVQLVQHDPRPNPYGLAFQVQVGDLAIVAREVDHQPFADGASGKTRARATRNDRDTRLRGSAHQCGGLPCAAGKSHWPADLYLEGGDQYRGWFHSSLLVGVGVKGGSPYRSCALNGWALDGEGRAMHKSLGNAIEPEEVIKKVGAEILRLWIFAGLLPFRGPGLPCKES